MTVNYLINGANFFSIINKIMRPGCIVANIFYKYFFILLVTSLFANTNLLSQNKTAKIAIDRIDPPHWWTGFINQNLQLCVHGNNISATTPAINYSGVTITNVIRPENKNYLFIDLKIDESAKPGVMNIQFTGGKKNITFPYLIKQRNISSAGKKGLNTSDAIYLMMPDRFANGDTKNDVVPTMNCKDVNRDSLIMRHGGDLQGVMQHLNYIKDLGFNALWLNPVVENNQPTESYHGYAFTDQYKIDARLGTNSLYKQLVDTCHKLGMKMIYDIVLNHIGNQHYLIKDLPANDFVHQWNSFTRTTYKDGTLMDIYAADADKKQMTDGWFDVHMPDLNQQNPLVENYLTQNAIWLIEEFDIDAFRIDTYAYSDLDFESRWAQKIKTEYPQFFMFAETWVHGITNQSFFTKNNITSSLHKSNIDGVTDFQLYYATNDALNQPFGWTEGVNRWYHALCADYVYQNPNNNILFVDNHDLSRYWSVCGKSLDKYKMGLIFMATTRGIPSMYYGTEILMENFSNGPSSNVRNDFPGGWPGDKINYFEAKNLPDTIKQAHEFITKLFNFRKNNPTIYQGNLKQFVPVDGIYVYFRFNDDQTFMIVHNSNNTAKELSLNRFEEMIPDTVYAKDVMTGKVTQQQGKISLEKNQSVIFQIMKTK
ncbi:MAG TPA: alpha-amylase family glycosyl hydrolase [Bacteroidia bacterium]|nr:alpha-amylase family glycosyl hydrolase [Bacteroidia bacterium]